MSSHEHGKEDDCVDYIERIVYFIDNELDQADCAVVEMHLRECGPCLERHDLQKAVKQLVARSCSESAPGVPARPRTPAAPRGAGADHRGQRLSLGSTRLAASGRI